MPELGVAWVNVSNRHDRGNEPLVRAATVKVGSGPFHRSRYFISARRAVEGERFIGVVGVSNLYLVRRLGIVPPVYLVRQPQLVPFIDLVEVGRVVAREGIGRDGAQVLHHKRVHGRDLL